MVKIPSGHGVTRGLALLGAALLTVFCVATALVGGVTASVTGFQVGYLTGFAGYGLILLSHRRRAAPISSREWTLWIALCLSLRAVLIPLAPSDDVNRYIWEGLVQTNGFDPYTIPPDDPRLAGIDDALRVRVNHPHFPAIYPPLAQLTFRAAATISPTPLCFKLMHATWDMITVLLLPGAIANGLGSRPRRASAADRAPANSPPHPSTPIEVSAFCPRALALIYALCPLTLTAFAIEGHLDSLMLMLLVAALRLLPAERRVLKPCSYPGSVPRASARAMSQGSNMPESADQSSTLVQVGGAFSPNSEFPATGHPARRRGSTGAIGSRAISAGAILGCAISAKAVVVLLLPWLAIRRPMVAAIAIVSAALWHVPFHDSGLAPFRNLVRFSQYGEVFSIAQLIGAIAPGINNLDASRSGAVDHPTRDGDARPSDSSRASRGALRILGWSLLTLAVGWSTVRSATLALHTHRSLAALLFTSPIVHAWYGTWLVALAPFHEVRWPLAAAAASVLYYEAFRPVASGAAWRMPLSATLAFWLIVGAVSRACKFRCPRVRDES